MEIFMVELTNKCNEDCWFCPHSKMSREQGFMSLDTVKMVISKIDPRNSVMLNNLGESLLHPNFFDIVEMFEDASIETMITTNAHILDESLVEKIIKSNLTNIRLSVDFLQNDKIIQPLLTDSRVIVNIKGVDRDTISMFRDTYGDKGIITYLVDFAGQMDFSGDFAPYKNCAFLNSNGCVVLWDGRICACCYDYDANNILGHINDLENLKHTKKYTLCETCNGVDFREI